MRLANMLSEEFIVDDDKSTTKEEVIERLLEVLKCKSPGIDTAGIKELIMEREQIEDTSYGRGFAFPHARTDKVGEMFILMGICRKGLSDKTADGVPLSVVVLLLTPSYISNLYLQTLSAFATFARMEGNLEKIISTKNHAEVIEVFYNSGVSVEKELKVKDIMTRDVATVDYKTLISNLNYSMDIEPFEELLKHEDKIKVSQLYSTDHEVTTMDTRIVEVAAMMIFKDLRRVFVTEKGKLVGILLRKNIVSMIIRG